MFFVNKNAWKKVFHERKSTIITFVVLYYYSYISIIASIYY